MAHKTLRMMAIAYNLVHNVMQKAAAEASKPLAERRFKGSLDTVNSSQVVSADPWWQVTKYEKMVIEVMLTCAGKLRDYRSTRMKYLRPGALVRSTTAR